MAKPRPLLAGQWALPRAGGGGGGGGGGKGGVPPSERAGMGGLWGLVVVRGVSQWLVLREGGTEGGKACIHPNTSVTDVRRT